jgi:hypothetical protein
LQSTRFHLLLDKYLILSVGFEQINLYQLIRSDIGFETGVIRLDGELSAGPLHENSQFDCPRPAQIYQGIKCRPRRTTCVQNIINEDNDFIIDIETDFRCANLRLSAALRGI